MEFKWIDNYETRSMKLELWSSNYEVWIMKLELWIPNHESQIMTQKSTLKLSINGNEIQVHFNRVIKWWITKFYLNESEIDFILNCSKLF